MTTISYNNTLAEWDIPELIELLTRSGLYWEYCQDNEIYIQGYDFDITLTLRRTDTNE